eukprot:492997_1
MAEDEEYDEYNALIHGHNNNTNQSIPGFIPNSHTRTMRSHIDTQTSKISSINTATQDALGNTMSYEPEMDYNNIDFLDIAHTNNEDEGIETPKSDGQLLANYNENYYNKTSEISGIGLDECILKWLIRDFETRNKGCYIEIENWKTRLKLLKEITRIKQVLSSGSNQVRFDIESLYEGIDYHFTLSKPKFESIIYDILNNAINWINKQIKLSNISFDFVIVSGGLFEIPKLQNSLQNMFGDKLMAKLLSSKGIASNFVHAYGCAVQVASLSYLYQLQNQLRNEHQLLENIIDVTKNRKGKRNKKKQEQNVNTEQIGEKNAFLNNLENNKVVLSSKKILVHYILAQQRKQFCCINKYSALPFEMNYIINENDIKMLLNNNKEIEHDLEFDISFTVNIMDDKSMTDSMEQTINNISIKGKKKKKSLLINVSLDDNNDLNVCIGKEKVLFELDEGENESDDNDNEDGEFKTDDIDQNDDTLDID